MPGNVRPLIKILEAVGLDPPANTTRSQEQIFLNYALTDLERLTGPIPHPHGQTRNFVPAVVGEQSAMRLIPGPKGCRVTFVQSGDPGQAIRYGVQPALLGTFPTTIQPLNNWGGPVTSVLQLGSAVAGVIALSTILQNEGDKHTENDFLIPVFPGEVFYVRASVNNQATICNLGWDEPL